MGEIVTLKDENLPPGKWSLGRVVKKYAGSDRHTRVVDVKTANNVLKRAITKIAPLPVREKSKIGEQREAPVEKRRSKILQGQKIMPILITLLAAFTLTSMSINAERTANDVAKTVIDGAVRVYTSDVTNGWAQKVFQAR